MTDAPERIWDFWPHDGGSPVVWREPCPFTADDADVFEYVRADLARPMTVAEAAKVLGPELDQLMASIVAMPIGRHRREALAKVTEIRAMSQGGE